MCNEETISTNIHRYEPLSNEKYSRRAQTLINLWEEFLKSSGEEGLKWYLHEYNLYEVITRHDKRKHYFEVFHAMSSPCEYKYIAIECFWINTLKPFMVIDEKSSVYNCPNEMFSLFLIMATIRGVYEDLNPGKKFKYLSEHRMRDILYDFKYCSLNREAMVSFVETLADTYGVGIEYLLTNKKPLKLPTKLTDLWS